MARWFRMVLATFLLAALMGFSSAAEWVDGGVADQGAVLQQQTEDCWPESLPVGAIAGQPSTVFCDINRHGPDTSLPGTNTWVDDFDHGLSLADFQNTRYRLFESVGFVNHTLHWRHADHWMVDVATRSPSDPAGWVRGGGLMRPDSSFRFENGRLVIEVDAAAGITGYASHAWPEIVISTGEQPVDTGSLYAYDLFPEDWTIGCRLQDSRYPVCTLKDNNGDRSTGSGSKQVWEMSAHQQVGMSNFGGFPMEVREKAWRVCNETDPDMVCRDRFRLELTQTTLTLFVNGEKYFEQTGVPPLPNEFVSGDLYIYFASMVVSHPADAVRFHWDRISIQPESPADPVSGIDLSEMGEWH